MSTGIAKPTPDDEPLIVYIAVFIPIKLPELSSSGPPLLPGEIVLIHKLCNDSIIIMNVEMMNSISMISGIDIISKVL